MSTRNTKAEGGRGAGRAQAGVRSRSGAADVRSRRVVPAWVSALLPALPWVIVALVLMGPVMGYWVALLSPDTPPFFGPGEPMRRIEGALGSGSPMTPLALFWFLMPPLVWHDLGYFVDALLVAAGGVYLLRGRGVPRWAAWCGGGALAFAGYSFTLIAAGHRGYFDMAVYGVWLFGFVLRAVRTGRWSYYGLAGACAGWCLSSAPDFSFIYLAVAAAYGVWLVASGAGLDDGLTFGRRFGRAAVRLPLVLLLLAVTCWGSVRHVFTDLLPYRESQIARAAGVPAAKRGEAQVGEREKWIFATNWSLPPEETLEFVAPCVLGNQSSDPELPYWGRLGRTDGWETDRRGFTNFRQHTVYLGGAQLALALLAVACAWRFRRRRTKPEVASPCGMWLADAPFWSLLAVGALLLAFGRYAPFYRLFYALPYLSLLRAPVKLVRMVELPVMMLAAGGIACLGASALQGSRLLRRWALAAGSLAAVCGLGALLVSVNGEAIGQALQPLGLISRRPELQANAARALWHGAVAFGVAAAAGALRGWGRFGAGALTVGLAAWLAIDAVSVDRRFIAGGNVEPYHRANTIVAHMVKEGGPSTVIGNYASPNLQYDWFSSSLWANGIFNCVPSPGAPETSPFVRAQEALRGDPIRFWELCGASHVLLPAQAARQLAGPRLQPLAAFELGAGSVGPVKDEKRAVVLARVNAALPFAWLSPTWRSVAEEDPLDVLLEPGADPRREAIVAEDGPPGAWGDSAAAAGNVKVQSVRLVKSAMSTRLSVCTPAEQFLTVRMRPATAFEARVDGRRVPLVPANVFWCGLRVPAGDHEVELRVPRRPWPPLLGLAPLLLAIPLLKGRTREP